MAARPGFGPHPFTAWKGSRNGARLIRTIDLTEGMSMNERAWMPIPIRIYEELTGGSQGRTNPLLRGFVRAYRPPSTEPQALSNP